VLVPTSDKVAQTTAIKDAEKVASDKFFDAGDSVADVNTKQALSHPFNYMSVLNHC